MKKPISERALLARINRALDDDVVKKCRRDSRQWYSLGDYYSVDLMTNVIIDKDIDLEAYGRELGCLTEFESLEQDKQELEDTLKAGIEQINKLQADYDAMSKEQKAALPKTTRKFFGG